MHIAIQVAAGLAVLSEPFLPHSAKKLQEMLLLDKSICWNSFKDKMPVKSNHLLGNASLLFGKIDDDIIAAQLVKLTS